MLSRCFLDFSVGVRAFVKGPSQVPYFFSWFSCDPLWRQFIAYLFTIIHWAKLLTQHLIFYRLAQLLSDLSKNQTYDKIRACLSILKM